MKIAILSHFGRFNPAYALHIGWRERANLLAYHGQDFDFLCNRDVPETEYPHALPVLDTIPTDRPFSERALFFEKQYLDLLPGYDAILTADLIYQQGGNFLAQNQAARRVAEILPARWYHWVHSAWTERPADVDYPQVLRYAPINGRSTIVYQNESERNGIARQYGIDPAKIAVVFNAKDSRSFNGWQPLSWHVSRALDFPGKDAIQVLPFCATRMEAKGIDATVKAFAALKRLGVKVALVLAAGHAWKVPVEIAAQKRRMDDAGLVEGVDYLWTHDMIDGHRSCPREVVADLFQAANLFVYGSWRENCPQALLEARTAGCLLVVNKHVKPLVEFAGADAITFTATHKTPGKTDYADGDLQEASYANATEYFDQLAGLIMARLPSKKHQWLFCYDFIWRHQLRPLLYGDA